MPLSSPKETHYPSVSTSCASTVTASEAFACKGYKVDGQTLSPDSGSAVRVMHIRSDTANVVKASGYMATSNDDTITFTSYQCAANAGSVVSQCWSALEHGMLTV